MRKIKLKGKNKAAERDYVIKSRLKPHTETAAMTARPATRSILQNIKIIRYELKKVATTKMKPNPTFFIQQQKDELCNCPSNKYTT